MTYNLIMKFQTPISRRKALQISALGILGAGLAGCLKMKWFSIFQKKELKMTKNYDALIVGAGPAGLTAAMTLGRIHLTALICDDDRPRNKPSSHVNNFPTRDGIHPEKWREAAREDLKKYPTIESQNTRVLSIQKISDSEFEAQLQNGQTVKSKKVILAYGVQDRMPNIPHFKELWGKSIYHCPFCHGFENRGKKIGFLANHDMALHPLPMLEHLFSDLIIFTNGPAQFSPTSLKALKNNHIPIIEEPIADLHAEGEVLKSVTLKNAETLERDALFYFASEPFLMKSDLGEKLGCEKTEFGFYKVGMQNETTTSGVFACGDNMSMAHSVLLASASGVIAGGGVIASTLGAKFKA